MTSALDGLRVLDFSRLLPGPYCTWLMADQGAEVIRVENPRELAKQAKVFGWEKLGPEEMARQRGRDMLARGKKSIMLDIGDETAQGVLRQLAATCDIIVEDYRPGVLAGLGLGYTDMAAENPALVYLSLTLTGAQGPLAGKPGHDPVALALSGVLSRCGEDPDAPGLPGIPAADIATGAHAAFAALAAWHAARATGQGRHVDVAMADCSMTMLANILSRHENPADAPPRGTRRADLGLWQCADGKWLCTTDMEPRYWATFCTVMGVPQFTSAQLDAARRNEIRSTLAGLFATQPRAHWLTLFEEAGTQFAPVNDVSEALAEPHFRARRMVVEVEAPGGALTQLGPPVRLGGEPAPAPARLPGTDTEAVLGRLGLGPDDIQALTRAPTQMHATAQPSPAQQTS
ncbi:CaiB/BaiF CoA transferase family protein [Vannielia litorea]|uniref:CaiB/BaiF CoA transferase family protein n=1 Tax=Vannielia litorea TaxID=1217970 RepID=UPI001BCF499F|nr:CaiB/BaiF CoA-transferase family protein [Vannielia litorea]MBS8225429.1 CoA transferase [Vannielia litorea]